ncbi:LytTR family DNA-binding domain-containing protein [Flagellimonas sp. CMM7]|uniref:LytR/AlgR family response regulator transcription factor n=1 Tax=Flagellimonas sp. CMM7 TaxID=2654676 RepID=UPI0013D6C5D6|nr:LytTR family DNA-binding domain-containing protein [Flagellimonas sp. CMM7]UII80398.1 LytTR family DNA-binding domain-containing protein [Flagellimonas sp. CMM7]
MKKVIIVDDEEPARKLIKEFLQPYKDLVIIEECNNGVDAVKAINTFKPDLVFLDIQTPGFTGFEVLQRLQEMPQIIFSTAYDQYAFKAFEVHAVDYLLKPFKQERFDEAIEKIMTNDKGYLNQIQTLVNGLNEQETHLTNILVSVRNKLINIPIANIIYIQADGNYAKLILEKSSHLTSYGLSKLEEKLNPQQFIRVHRSTVININAVKEAYSYPSSYELIMTNGDIVKVSRSYLDNIRKLIV